MKDSVHTIRTEAVVAEYISLQKDGKILDINGIRVNRVPPLNHGKTRGGLSTQGTSFQTHSQPTEW